MVQEDDEPTRFDVSPWHVRGVPDPAGLPFEPEDDATVVVSRKRWRKIVPAAIPSATPSAPPVPSAEPLEHLSLPPGLDEDMLRHGAVPRNALQVRIDLVRVVRVLGREYAARGQVLRADAEALVPVQRHLHACCDAVRAGRLDRRALAPEIIRHGALFGEILARTLNATWSNLTDREPACWQMTVPPLQQVNPVQCVHDFLLQRQPSVGGEPDLVTVFEDLSRACHRSSHIREV
jgi:hypothetical protein